ncbi:MAG: TonB family protein [Verrucomicrobia bacterium]|nr:TonB family protein [Verrucomicrobiota bacterium]
MPALPRVDTRPVPRPEPPPPTTPPPAPAPQPTQQAQPQPQPPQQISIDDFRRNRPVPDRVQTRPTQQNRPVDVPRIDTSDILRNLQSNVVNISASELQSLTVAQQSDLNAYHDQIRARLRAVFRPNAANLEATAQFTVLANGRVVNASIIRSSGDPVFDAAVLQAFRDMQSPGPPPGNRSYDFRIILRSSDGRR